MRTIADSFKTKQQADLNYPELRLEFNAYSGGIKHDYSTRCLGLEHHESQFNENALIVLDNADGMVENLLGYWIEIGYGYVDETTSPTSRLYVMEQTNTSAEGILISTLQLEGIWSILDNTLITIGDAPSYTQTYSTSTIKEIISEILEHISTDRSSSTINFDIEVKTGHDDLIFDTFVPPDFALNRQYFEYARDVIYTLMQMTKTYLRPKPSDGTHTDPWLEGIYPQDDDEADATFFSYAAPWFFEGRWTERIMVPNVMKVFGGASDDGVWPAEGEGLRSSRQDNTDQTAIFMEMHGLELCPELNLDTECLTRASALLSRASLEASNGSCVMPHDARLELFDKIKLCDARIVDARGQLL